MPICILSSAIRSTIVSIDLSNEMSGLLIRIFKVIAANCPHGTTGNNEFQVWSKITADSDDGGTTFVNGTMYVMEIEE